LAYRNPLRRSTSPMFRTRTTGTVRQVGQRYPVLTKQQLPPRIAIQPPRDDVRIRTPSVSRLRGPLPELALDLEELPGDWSYEARVFKNRWLPKIESGLITREELYGMASELEEMLQGGNYPVMFYEFADKWLDWMAPQEVQPQEEYYQPQQPEYYYEPRRAAARTYREHERDYGRYVSEQTGRPLKYKPASQRGPGYQRYLDRLRQMRSMGRQTEYQRSPERQRGRYQQPYEYGGEY